MNIIQTVVLGIVQGLTEFLPISSTAHLRIVPALLGWNDPGAAYTAIIQLGTTAAVLVYFAKDIARIAQAWLKALINKKPFESHDARLGWYVIVGTIPVVIAGLALKHYIESQFRSLYVIAASAIIMAIVLALAEKFARHTRRIESVTWMDGIGVGLAQAVAIFPGASRSGTTLTGGLFMGLRRDAAARFSFLLSIPATVAAGLFEMRHAWQSSEPHAALAIGPLVLGSLVSFVVGLASIAGLLRFLRTRTTAIFVVYRILLGVVLLGLLGLGFLSP